MPRKYRKVVRKWKESDAEEAMNRINEGSSIRSSTRLFGMCESTLRKQIIRNKNGMTGSTQGNKTVLTKEAEAELAKCITIMCRYGLRPTISWVRELVAEYLEKNNIGSKFKNGRPGKDWFEGFMKRNRLSEVWSQGLSSKNVTPSSKKSKKSPRKMTPKSTPKRGTHANITPIGPGSSIPVSHCQCSVCIYIGPMPAASIAPEGKQWIPTWVLVDKTPTPNAPSNDGFEEIIKQISSTTSEVKKARRKVDLKCRVFARDKFRQAIKEKENATGKMKNIKIEDSDAIVDKACVSELEGEFTEIKSRTQKRKLMEGQDDDSDIEFESAIELESAIVAIHKSLDDDKKGLYYAVFYGDWYYWGKVMNVFSEDIESDVHEVEFSFLNYKMDGIWDFPKKTDRSIVATKYIFFGPVTPSEVIVGTGVRFAEDVRASDRYKLMKIQ